MRATTVINGKLEADAIVGVNAAYPQGWTLQVHAVDALADGRVHSLVEVRHGEQRFFANSRFTFDGPLIAAAVEHWATAEAPPAWRDATLLDAEVESDRARLAGQLIEGVQLWAPLVAGWPDERYDGSLEYTTTRGVPAGLPFAATLTHVFNHGSHHRGQITAALTALGQPCPELDLIWMLQAQSKNP